MDSTPLLASSSLSSRSQATTEQSSTITPNVTSHFSFRHRRRSRPRRRPPISANHTSLSGPTTLQSQPERPKSPRPLHRIRTKISVFDRSSKSTVSHQQETKQKDIDAISVSSPSPSQRIQPIMSISVSTPSSSTPSPASSNVKQNLNKSNNDENKAIPRRMLTNTSALKKRPIRRLAPPPRSVFHEKGCASITDFLRPELIPVGYSPDAADPTFKAHCHMLKKLTIDDFDLNRYLFIFKPLARVNCILASTLLSVQDIEQRTFPMSSALRSAIVYLTGNAHRSLYVMTYSAQLKSVSRSRPAAEGGLPGMVLEGIGLTDAEVACLDYCQEITSTQASVTELTKRKLQRMVIDPDGKLERLISAGTAYASFLSTLTSTIDVELTHKSIQYATQNLDGLPWKRSGVPINVDFLNDEVGDFGSGNGRSGLGSKYRPKRERMSLTRNQNHHERHQVVRERNTTGSNISNHRVLPRSFRRVSQFLTSAFSGSKGVNDVNQVTEDWMKTANVPAGDQLFEINDELMELFGFHPFYFSTTAMDCEATRRSFLYGCKELLFSEMHVSRRLKFIICYVLSSSKERRRLLDNDKSHSFEKQGIHNGHSINSVYSHRTYDSLSIMSAHAAFLACKYGVKTSELVAATDESRVRSAMEKYSPNGNSKLICHSIGFPLSKRDCAAVLIAHSLVKETTFISTEDLRIFGDVFGYPGRIKEGLEDTSRTALLEIIGCASMWQAIESFATGALGFDIDFTSTMMFGLGRAEPQISEFSRGSEGKKIGLSLGCNELRNVTRARSDSRPFSSKKNGNRQKRIYKKRTSSALNS